MGTFIESVRVVCFGIGIAFGRPTERHSRLQEHSDV